MSVDVVLHESDEPWLVKLILLESCSVLILELKLESGDLTFDSGDLTRDSGDFILFSGDIAIDFGDFTINSGDFTLDPGDFTLEPGDFTLDDELGEFMLESRELLMLDLLKLESGECEDLFETLLSLVF